MMQASDLQKMTASGLTAFARMAGAEVADGATKAEMIAAIIAALEVAPAPTAELAFGTGPIEGDDVTADLLSRGIATETAMVALASYHGERLFSLCRNCGERWTTVCTPKYWQGAYDPSRPLATCNGCYLQGYALRNVIKRHVARVAPDANGTRVANFLIALAMDENDGSALARAVRANIDRTDASARNAATNLEKFQIALADGDESATVAARLWNRSEDADPEMIVADIEHKNSVHGATLRRYGSYTAVRAAYKADKD